MNIQPPDTRTALIEAALFCFSEHGYDGTSIRTIASRAGRPLSLISHHFGSKDGLYLEVFRSLFKPFSTPARQDGLPDDRAEAVRQLREQVQMLYLDICPGPENQCELKEAGRRLWFLEMREPRPEVLELLQERFGPRVSRVRGLIRVLRPELTEADITFLGTTILGQISGHGLIRGISTALWGKNELTHAQSADLITQFTLRGLGLPSV